MLFVFIIVFFFQESWNDAQCCGVAEKNHSPKILSSITRRKGSKQEVIGPHCSVEERLEPVVL